MPERSTQSNNHRRLHGQILVMFAAAMFAILGFAALAVDVGFLLAERRGAQNAADAAAMAAARHVARGNDAASAAVVGQQYADRNGFPNSGETLVDIESNGNTIEVVVEHQVTSFFIGAFIDADWSVRTTAIAEVVPDPGPFAIIALGFDPSCQSGPNGSGIQFQGNANVNIMNGSIGSNACIQKTGGAGSVFIEGNVEAYEHIVNGHGIQQPAGSYAIGSANEITDPYDGISAPTCSDEGGEYEPGDDEELGPVDGIILTPGRYPGNLPTGNGPTTVNLLPGIYCIEGSVQKNNGLLRSVDADYPVTGDPGDGGGVLLYFTGSGRFQVAGNASVRLRSIGLLNPNFDGCATTDACDEQFVIWVSEGACTEFFSRGNNGTIFEGVVYAPCSQVTIGGTPGTEVSSGQVVADMFATFGNATFNLYSPDGYQGQPTRVYLVQ